MPAVPSPRALGFLLMLLAVALIGVSVARDPAPAWLTFLGGACGVAAAALLVIKRR